MATRTYLNAEELAQAEQLLKSKGAQALSLYLGEKLQAKLAAHPNWRAAKPIRLGSWARDELCLRSDFDLLFIGEEKKVAEMVQDFQRDGIKIRYRMPADPKDWTINVEAFDVIALLTAKVFFAEDSKALHAQVEQIHARGLKYKKQLYQTMKNERVDRAKRYDSIANYLEPNLKYGHGGLRDLEQALVAYNLIFNKSEPEYNHKEIQEVMLQLEKYKLELLAYRHFIHLRGASDVFVSHLQQEASEFFNFEQQQKFMSHLEKTLSEVSFGANWLSAISYLPKKYVLGVEKIKIESIADAFAALKTDSSVVIQQKVRKAKLKIENKKSLGKIIEKYINAKMTDEFLIALFGSRLLQLLLPDLARLTGHVQHDQYHRYSVDAHTLQAMRGVLRVKKNPKTLGQLAKHAKILTEAEWSVLLFAALFHDLGKGLKGDHSNEGAAIVKREMTSLGLSLKTTVQVTWLVHNHLIISTAAFRHNPQSPSTWTYLFQRGVRGRRILTLTLLTAIDIRATNPDAWSDWKERLLNDLALALQSQAASQLDKFIEEADKKKIKLDRNFIEKLDTQIVSRVPQKVLLKEYSLLKKAKSDLAPLVIRNRKGETWVRFHRMLDMPGLFYQFTRDLFDLGLSVQEAFVQTYEIFGVYDWFKVKSAKSTAQIKQSLINASSKTNASGKANNSVVLEIRFAVIEVVSQDEQSAIISFRGKDQRGALLAAAQALRNCGLEIQSAKVHTWGRQIDDVFTVKKSHDFDAQIERMRTALT